MYIQVNHMHHSCFKVCILESCNCNPVDVMNESNPLFVMISGDGGHVMCNFE